MSHQIVIAAIFGAMLIVATVSTLVAINRLEWGSEKRKSPIKKSHRKLFNLK